MPSKTDLKKHRQVALTCNTSEVIRRIGDAVIKGGKISSNDWREFDFWNRQNEFNKLRNDSGSTPGPGSYYVKENRHIQTFKIITPETPREERGVGNLGRKHMKPFVQQNAKS